MDASTGKASPSPASLKSSRRRSRPSLQRKGGGPPKGHQRPLPAKEPYQWQGEKAPAKAYCRVARALNLFADTAVPFEAPQTGGMALSREDAAAAARYASPPSEQQQFSLEEGREKTPRLDAGASTFHLLSAPSEAATSFCISSLRSPVKGVYYDSFKKLWRVQWHTAGDPRGPAEGRRMSRSFSCSRLGFDAARARAVAWMLSGGLVGDGGVELPTRSAHGTLPLGLSKLCSMLAATAGWEMIEDRQIKEFVAFYDPKKFLLRVEGYYVAQKLCGGSLTPSPCSALPLSASNALPSSINCRETGVGVPSVPLPPETAPTCPDMRGALAGKRGPRGALLSSRQQRALSPLGLDDMLRIVWGSPEDAAAYIITGLNGGEPPEGPPCESRGLPDPEGDVKCEPAASPANAEGVSAKAEDILYTS
ncbi:hypothetical protein cyc_03674 [Cyclospora cayetanensis]|uniref:Uncharacterized protein n=1 Tax=Cyclospora cayetanensis TaxID=88456 RepID=A0A1D3D9X2_9EIME|nr:hypothetical protein cyc_03674 [Cyclospora cayetanensis]